MRRRAPCLHSPDIRSPRAVAPVVSRNGVHRHPGLLRHHRLKAIYPPQRTAIEREWLGSTWGFFRKSLGEIKRTTLLDEGQVQRRASSTPASVPWRHPSSPTRRQPWALWGARGMRRSDAIYRFAIVVLAPKQAATTVPECLLEKPFIWSSAGRQRTGATDGVLPHATETRSYLHRMQAEPTCRCSASALETGRVPFAPWGVCEAMRQVLRRGPGRTPMRSWLYRCCLLLQRFHSHPLPLFAV